MIELDLNREMYRFDEDGKKLPAVLLTKNYRAWEGMSDKLLFQIGHSGDHYILLTDTDGYPVCNKKLRPVVNNVPSTYPAVPRVYTDNATGQVHSVVNIPTVVTAVTRFYKDNETGKIHIDVNNNYHLKESVLPLRLIGKYKNEVEV